MCNFTEVSCRKMELKINILRLMTTCTLWESGCSKTCNSLTELHLLPCLPCKFPQHTSQFAHVLLDMIHACRNFSMEAAKEQRRRDINKQLEVAIKASYNKIRKSRVQ